MARFYFIDSNIILGYCNPYDRLHLVTVPFFNAISNKRHIFLLHSIEKEYYRKIRHIRIDFEKKITRKLKQIDELSTEDVKCEFLTNPNTRSYNFEKYIFELFKEDNITTITYSSMMKPLSKFISRMRYEFRMLTAHWIVRPKAKDYPTTILESRYLFYKNKIGLYLHSPDDEHLSLAAFFVENRSGPHDYFFYTDDNLYLLNNLEAIVNIEGFKIKKIKYNVLVWLVRDPNTGRNTIRREELEFVPDEDLM